MVTIVCIIAVFALISALASLTWGKPPVVVAVLLVAIAEVMHCLPLR